MRLIKFVYLQLFTQERKVVARLSTIGSHPSMQPFHRLTAEVIA